MPRTTLDRLAVHYSSARDDWATPDHIFQPLDEEFGFTFDVAASADNAKCRRFYSVIDDGLHKPWRGTIWCNPPYGKRITSRWVEKAIRSSYEGAVVVMLVPARPGSIWFQELMRHAEEIRFVAAHVKFVGAPKPAPFPSAIAILRQPPSRARKDHELPFTMPTRHDGDPWTVMRPGSGL